MRRRARNDRPALAAIEADLGAQFLLWETAVAVAGAEAALERSVRRLHRFLEAELPFSWRIVVADNASTDATPAIAARLAATLRDFTGGEAARFLLLGRRHHLRCGGAGDECSGGSGNRCRESDVTHRGCSPVLPVRGQV